MPVLYAPQSVPVPGPVNVWPQLIVEAAFGPAAPVGGQFDLVLNDPSVGLLNHDVLAAGDTWTDITQWVQSGTVSRPYTRQQGPLTLYQGGTASFVLNNADSRFSPWNLSGPYVSAGITQVRPMIPVRVRAVWAGTTYTLWQGFATSWVPPGTNWGFHYDQTTLTCSDAFYVFNGVNVPAANPVGAGELSGARVQRILTAAGWYAGTGMAVIDTGSSTLQAYAGGDTALNMLQLVCDCELGELYMDSQGRVRFRGRNAVITETRSTTPQAVFGDRAGTVEPDGTELAYTLVSMPSDDTTLANDIQATIVGSSNVQEVQDAASIATYLFPRTYQRSDLILQTDSAALQWADYVLHVGSSDQKRFDQLTITPGRDPAALWPQALGRELGDRIQVWRRPPGMASISEDLLIRGITHTFAATSQTWTTVWDLQAAINYTFIILNDPKLGTLNYNSLGF